MGVGLSVYVCMRAYAYDFVYLFMSSACIFASIHMLPGRSLVVKICMAHACMNTSTHNHAQDEIDRLKLQVEDLETKNNRLERQIAKMG
jgi:hypothetical protein